jgi:hypothetical protein
VVATKVCAVDPPGLHTLLVALLEVNVTLPPVQKLVGPPAEMVGVVGAGFTVTTTGTAEAELHPDAVAKTA